MTDLCTDHHPACQCREIYFDGLEEQLALWEKMEKEKSWVPIGWFNYAQELEDKLGIKHKHGGEL